MILAAGEGRRLWPFTLGTPKVLVPLGEVILIEHTLSWLKDHGVSEVIMNLYHAGEKIRSFLGDGSRFGMKLCYSVEEKLLGTAGGVRQAGHFFNDTFAVVYGDTLTDFDLTAMAHYHESKRSLVTLAIVEVTNPEDMGVVEINEEGRILSFVEKPRYHQKVRKLASCGIYIFQREILNHIPDRDHSDFAYDVFPQLLKLNIPFYGYRLKPEDYFIDIGTPARYQRAREDVAAGRVRLRRARRAVFLDRDGTIARDVHYCRTPEDFELLPTVPEAIRHLNESGFQVVVITNQSGIARGYFTEETLAEIHRKMEAELSQHGARVDAIYHCPHHPNDGCQCRKPKTGMFQQAIDELNLNPRLSYVVGDAQMDIEAGKALGAKTVLVTTGPQRGMDITRAPSYTAGSLLEAARWITQDYETQARQLIDTARTEGIS
jgi:histidinol-phosphate phosphatase family protein